MTQLKIQQAAIAAVLFYLIIGAYCVLAAAGAVPAAPWSPLGA